MFISIEINENCNELQEPPAFCGKFLIASFSNLPVRRYTESE